MLSLPELLGPDGQSYRVGTIYCIGRNYRNHAREMGASVPEHPVIFSKAASAFTQGPILQLPSQGVVHHELEVVVLIGKAGVDIPESEGWDYVSGLALGLDLTLRDLQSEFKSKRLPWFRSKSFHQSAVVTLFHNPDLKRWEAPFWLEANHHQVQQGRLNEMIFSIPRLIAEISSFSTFYPGDMIYTGTPEGVGPLKPGQELTLGLGNETLGRFTTR